VAYPNLADDVLDLLKMLVGPEVYPPVADGYRSKLRSATQAKKDADSQPQRKTPRYLRVIASPDDTQRRRLETGYPGDVAMLRWDVMKEYSGAADIITTKMLAIP
jgi:hypothetical protein